MGIHQVANRPAVGLPSNNRDHGKLGPAMQALTPMMRAFVWAMLETGSVNYKACARMAGYAGNDNVLAVTGHKLAHDERIQVAIQEEARKRMTGAALMAAGHLVTIADSPGHKDQMTAIKELLNRSGLHAVTEQRISVTHSTDRQAQLKEIIDLAKATGVDVQKMLGSFGVVVDAEFNEVVDDESSIEGLEDLV